MDHSSIESLTAAVQRYFDLMYDGDTSRFDRVFRSSAQLHGFREGKLTMWSAPAYKEVLEGRPSPKSLKAPREEEILMLDFASPTQALAKVRVRISTNVLILTRTVARAWVGEAKSSIRISSSRGALSDLGDGQGSR